MKNINLGNSTVSKLTAVTAYGTQKQKAHWEKYGKFVNKTVESALIKTLEQNYESVEVVKIVGERAKQYKLGVKREEVEARKDERETNGRQTDYTRSMDAIIIAGLEKRRLNEKAGEQTMKKWLLDFGLISQELFDLMGSKYNKEAFNKTVADLVEAGVIDNKRQSKVVEDYIFLTNNLNEQLKNTLKKMAKVNLIKYMPVPYAKMLTEDGPEHIKIEVKTYQNILEHKTKLMELFSLTRFEVTTGTPTAKYKAWSKAYKDYLQNDVMENGVKLEIEFVYESFAIFRVGTKARTRKYLEKNNAPAFKALLNDEEKFLSDIKETFIDERLKFVVNKANLSHEKKQKYQGEKIADYIADNMMVGEEEEVNLKEVFYFDYEYQQLILDNLYVESIKNLQEYFGNL
ncbi:MAG: hypothetical protein WBA84_03890 [Carnobacterium sp.]|uniref:hypothetical protein n=1 Tax=Carnobacterium sp. TaxID=48221 RepID=UPI003C74E609